MNDFPQDNISYDVKEYKISDWAPTLTSIAFSTVGGFVIGGIPGMGMGFGLSIADEWLMSNNISNKHYLSSSAFWFTTTFRPIASFMSSTIPALEMPVYTAINALSMVAPYVINDFLDFRDKIELPLASFLTINQFFDEKEIISAKEGERIYNKFLENPYEALEIIADDIIEIFNNEFLSAYIYSNSLNLLKLAINNLSVLYLASYGSSMFINTLTNNHINSFQNFRGALDTITLSSLSQLFHGPLRGYLIEGSKIVGVFAAISVVEYVIDLKQYTLMEEQFAMLMQKCTELITKDGNANKILANDKGKEIIQHLAPDLVNLLFNGASKLSDQYSSAMQTLISLNNVLIYAPNIFAFYSATLIPQQMVLNKIADDAKAILEKSSEVSTQKWMVYSDLINNIEQIELRNGQEFIRHKYNTLLIEENSLDKKLEVHGKLKRVINDMITLFNKFSDIIYFGPMVIYKKLAITQVPLVKSSVQGVYSFLSSNIDFKMQNKELILSKERIDTLFKLLSAYNHENAMHTINDKQKIILKNYTLFLDGRTLVEIDHFEFAGGKYYAVTGKSGCGKTSVLIDIKEGVFGALSSNGEISLGYDQNEIMFLDQKLYLPKESTLLESIYFPKILSSLNDEEIQVLKDKVISLFKELDIDEFINTPDNVDGLISKLDSKEFKLSGGQTKKIAIIQVILNKPALLIMDETFTGLDMKSLIQVEQVILKYLPNTLILSVDHHAEDNNYNGFYDMEAHFADGTITFKEIATKYIDYIEPEFVPTYEFVTEFFVGSNETTCRLEDYSC